MLNLQTSADLDEVITTIIFIHNICTNNGTEKLGQTHPNKLEDYREIDHREIAKGIREKGGE